MNLAELSQLKKKREEEHRLDMEALDRVFRMQSLDGMKPESNGHVSASPNDRTEKQKKKPNKGLPNTLKKLVAEFGAKEFTINDVLELLAKKGKKAKRGTVKNAVKILVTQGVLNVVIQGMGRRQSVFIVKPQ